MPRLFFDEAPFSHAGRLGGVSLVKLAPDTLEPAMAVRIRRLSGRELLLGIAGLSERRGELFAMTGGLLGFCARERLLGLCCGPAAPARILICAVCVLVLFSHGDHSLSLANLALFTLHSITQAL
ncbi:MAG: hypothetical protein ACLTQI_08195 [Slackia sp.]